MLDLQTKQDIIDLFYEGVEIELMADELGVPQEELEKIINENKKNSFSNELVQETNNMGRRRNTRKSYSQAANKMDSIRNKYKSVMERKASNNEKSSDAISVDEISRRDQTFEKISNIISEYSKGSKEDKDKSFFEVIKLLKEVEDLPFTIEQSIFVLDFLNTCEMSDRRFSLKGKRRDNFQFAKKLLIIKLGDAVNESITDTTSPEELKRLSRILSLNVKEYNLRISSVQSKISQRLNNLLTETAIYKLRYVVSYRIEELIKKLANGDLDLDEAKKTIQIEAEEKFAKLPKNRFSVSVDQQRQQVLMQIRAILSDRADEFPIKNPKKTVELLDDLTDSMSHNQNILTTVKNLYKNERVEVAKQFVESELKKKTDYNFYRSLKREILGYEVGKMVLDFINNPHSTDEDNAFVEILEKRLKNERIPLSNIYLGTTDTGRKVSLADVWYEDYRKFRQNF